MLYKNEKGRNFSQYFPMSPCFHMYIIFLPILLKIRASTFDIFPNNVISVDFSEQGGVYDRANILTLSLELH